MLQQAPKNSNGSVNNNLNVAINQQVYKSILQYLRLFLIITLIFQLQEINTASCCAVHLYNHTAREDEIVEKVCNYNSLYFNISMKYCMF